jgi:glycosyltransferase involved in cell wall biosynthesis
MNISVCIASYNGAKFIQEQINSILKQLNENDEVIIIDDCSTDNTVEIIKSFNDHRIKLFINKVNKGHVYSFGKSISLSNNEIIFMSDQDDIWFENRVSLMVNRLTNFKVMLLSSNSEFIDENSNKILNYSMGKVNSIDSDRYLNNIFNIFLGKLGYYGCAMAFTRDLKEYILPIPIYVESHDLWIAKAANLLKTNLHCDDITLSRRIHGNNASLLKRKLLPILWSRIIFIISMIHLVFRYLLIKR